MRRVTRAVVVVVGLTAACTRYSLTPDPPDAAAPAIGSDAGDAGDAETAETTDSGVHVTDAQIVEASTATLDAGVFTSVAQRLDDFERPDLPNGGPLDFTIEPATNPYWQADGCGSTQPLGMCHGTTVRMMNDGTNGAGSGTYMHAPLAASSQQMRFDFDYELLGDQGSTSVQQTEVASIQLTNVRYVFLETKTGELFLGDQYLVDATTNAYDSEEIELGSLGAGWHHYQLFLDLVQAKVVLAIDGAATNAKSLQPQVAAEKLVAAQIGIIYQSGDSSINEVYDNVGLSEFP